jgi:hypothetical protein
VGTFIISVITEVLWKKGSVSNDLRGAIVLQLLLEASHCIAKSTRGLRVLFSSVVEPLASHWTLMRRLKEILQPGVSMELFVFLMRRNFILFLLLCWVGVCCSIYKGSYNISNISYLDLPLLSL